MTRLKKLYAPFYRKAKGDKWIRATRTDGYFMQAYKKDSAVKIYQDWLLAPFLNGIDEIRELRPIKD
jgi:hypothetical protein